jgi:hypothetical protein
MGEQAAEKLLWQTRTSLTYTFGVTGEHRAGCSKRPDFSPTRPWRTETRLAPSKAAGESKPEAYPLGYVEDFDEPRTKLAGFFSILRDGFTHIDHFPRGKRCSSSPALPRTPFHPYPKM